MVRFILSAYFVFVFTLSSVHIGMAVAEDKQEDAWPFVEWSHVKVYAYNFFPAREKAQWLVYQNRVWNKEIVSEAVVPKESGLAVSRIINATKGSFEVSACFFPRHAFVFFDGDGEPVAGVDICFECDGQRVWPDFDVKPEVKYGVIDEASGKQTSPGLYKEFEAGLAEYKQLLTKLGVPIDHTKK